MPKQELEGVQGAGVERGELIKKGERRGQKCKRERKESRREQRGRESRRKSKGLEGKKGVAYRKTGTALGPNGHQNWHKQCCCSWGVPHEWTVLYVHPVDSAYTIQ